MVRKRLHGSLRKVLGHILSLAEVYNDVDANPGAVNIANNLNH